MGSQQSFIFRPPCQPPKCLLTPRNHEKNDRQTRLQSAHEVRTSELHEAKQNRQLIFASHNANIVVNGSAELVGHLDLKESGDREFADTGAIDEPEICKVITSIMEGGEKAFKDRQDKYGY